ncbi:MAG: hypothetical protein AAF541_13330 [Pseudomonadota bacterium]
MEQTGNAGSDETAGSNKATGPEEKDSSSSSEAGNATAPPASQSAAQPRYEESGTWKIWGIAFVVLVGAIVLSI